MQEISQDHTLIPGANQVPCMKNSPSWDPNQAPQLFKITTRNFFH